MSFKKERERIESFIYSDIPNSKILNKRTSWYMKFIGKLMFFNRDFMKRYVTTLYPYIYVPSLPWKTHDNLGACATLAHEWVHLYDRKRMWLLFNFLYASPQCFAPFVLLAFYNLWFLLFLLCLLPIPSPGRAWAEFRGYRMTIAIYYWLSGQTVDLKWIVEHFMGSSYYYMWPFRSFLMRKFRKEVEKIKKGELSKDLQIIYDVIKKEQ